MAENPDTNSQTSAGAARASMRAAFLEDYSAAVEMASSRATFRYEASDRELAHHQRRARIVLDEAAAPIAARDHAIRQIADELNEELSDRRFIAMSHADRDLAVAGMGKLERYVLAERLQARADHFGGSASLSLEQEHTLAETESALADIHALEHDFGTSAQRATAALVEHTRAVEAAGGAKAFTYGTPTRILAADRRMLDQSLEADAATSVDPEVASAIETEISEIDRELAVRQFAVDMRQQPEATAARLTPAQLEYFNAAVEDHRSYYSSLDQDRGAEAVSAGQDSAQAANVADAREVSAHPARDAYFEARAQAGAVGVALHDPKVRDALKLGELYDRQARITAQIESAGERPGIFDRAERAAYDREQQQLGDELAGVELPVNYLEARLGPEPAKAVANARALVQARDEILAKTSQLHQDAIEEEVAREPEWLTSTLGPAPEPGPRAAAHQALARELAANRLRYAVTDDTDPGIRPNQTMLSDKVSQFAADTGHGAAAALKPAFGHGM